MTTPDIQTPTVPVCPISWRLHARRAWGRKEKEKVKEEDRKAALRKEAEKAEDKEEDRTDHQNASIATRLVILPLTARNPAAKTERATIVASKVTLHTIVGARPTPWMKTVQEVTKTVRYLCH